MRIATLNIRHGGGKRVKNIVDFINKISPDCILLTEFRNNLPGREISMRLINSGYIYQSNLLDDPSVNQLRWFSRLPSSEISLIDEIFETHHLLHRVKVLQLSDVRFIGVYFPQGLMKAPMFEFIKKTFPVLPTSKTALIGDFNTGSHWIDENANTFNCVEYFEALMSSGWIDAWRSRNPKAREFSWYSNKGNGFRIDNALLSPLLNQSVQQIHYMQDTIETKTSDHACLLIDVMDGEKSHISTL